MAESFGELLLFEDAELKKPITLLDLGTVQVGDSKEFTFYVQNPEKAMAKNVQIKIAHKEVEMLEVPDEIPEESSRPFRIKWSPTLAVKSGLKTKVEIKGAMLWS